MHHSEQSGDHQYPGVIQFLEYSRPCIGRLGLLLGLHQQLDWKGSSSLVVLWHRSGESNGLVVPVHSTKAKHQWVGFSACGVQVTCGSWFYGVEVSKLLLLLGRFYLSE